MSETREIELIESHTGYRCSCPLPLDDEDELRMALECWQREQVYQAAGGGQTEGE